MHTHAHTHTHIRTHTHTHTHTHIHTQVKAAKPHLKQLQQKVKALGTESQTLSDQSDSSRQSPDNFQWLTKEQTFVLVYLVSKCNVQVTANLKKKDHYFQDNHRVQLIYSILIVYWYFSLACMYVVTLSCS